MSFDSLPYELYECILNFVPSEELQQTVLSVTRAIPHAASFPAHHLFRSIRLKRPEQAILLYNRIRLRHASDPDIDSARALAAFSRFTETVGWIREFSIETWSVDAEIVINLVRLLPNLQSITIWIGPNNFAPEHLETLLSRPMGKLRYLALRFRPYVERATYYQFLKGAYFDSALTALSLWPPTGLPTVSIIQDPHNEDKAKRQGFAQPLVFFRLDLTNLLNSPVLSSSLQYLRLRIPSRPVARSLCVGTDGSAHEAYRTVKLPKLEFLDLSTCGILEAELDNILARFTTLKHMILDGCSILRGDLREEEASALGKRCALIGVRRAKDREKTLKLWLESRAVPHAPSNDGSTVNQVSQQHRSKGGRKGLATATISFRTPDPVIPPHVRNFNSGQAISVAGHIPLPEQVISAPGPSSTPQQGPDTQSKAAKQKAHKSGRSRSSSPLQQQQKGNQSSKHNPNVKSKEYKEKTQTIPVSNQVREQDIPVNDSSSPQQQGPSDQNDGHKPSKKFPERKPSLKSGKDTTSSATKNREPKKRINTKIRVLPSLPVLSSLSITLSHTIEVERYPAIRAEFAEGWKEGVAQLAVTRERLRTSARNGVRVMHIVPADADVGDIEIGSSEDWLYGLEDFDQEDPDAFGMSGSGITGLGPPILCFAGPGRSDFHEVECGHSIGWKVMKDEL